MKIAGFEKLFSDFEEVIIDKITFSKEFVQSTTHRDKRRNMTCPNDGLRMFFNKNVTREVYDLPICNAGCCKTASILYTILCSVRFFANEVKTRPHNSTPFTTHFNCAVAESRYVFLLRF